VRGEGVQEFRSSGVQEFRSSGVQEFSVGEPTKLQEKVGEVGEIGGASIQYTFISCDDPGTDGSLASWPSV